jgi:2-dehydro-3-deoxyphosphogalactonate aldolase
MDLVAHPDRTDRDFAELPLIAILRGIVPDEAIDIGLALVETGFRVIEVPLNSPEPIESIRRLAAAVGDRATVGAGTVRSAAEVAEVAAVGGRLIVSPHMSPQVIRATKQAGLMSGPGVATPTEAFAAIEAGADFLKLFPAEQLTPVIVKAWRAVLPKGMPLVPVGGITPDSMAAYMAAGATGFGLGSAIYKPGMTPPDVSLAAETLISAWRKASPDRSRKFY